MRIGLLGGTFNPPHIGHLVCAQEAWSQLGLDRVWLLPVHAPPHKAPDGDPGVEHRLAMCEAAVAGDERLEVSRVEADVPGRSYTVDTLNRLHEARPEDQLTFIVGGDMAGSLPQWREPRAILELCSLGVAARDGVGREQVLERLDRDLPGASDRIGFFDMPRIDISSTLVRRRVADGRPVRYLVPGPVAAYIEREGLYR
ncbi:MAG TPA: nicotinate-nucleotide adenylyltransferase [Solirubrobacteraceae bacterium]|nr:nicotinate-nucleotide adenylyltransferase [Solirubrobacteraceae bacterium]